MSRIISKGGFDFGCKPGEDEVIMRGKAAGRQRYVRKN